MSIKKKLKNGIKFDDDKIRWNLLPWEETEEIVKVLMEGSKKYCDDNWKIVPNAKERYFSALHRHMKAWVCGEKKDSETGFNHLAHAGACLLFLMWFDNQEKK